MMLGRKLLANAAPAATRSFRAAAVSMKMPTTEAEMDAYLAQPGNADLTADQIIAKLNAENPVASPASSGPDIVKEVFFDQQRKFRAFADKTKDLVPPVGGDDAAIEAYATKRNAVLKEVRKYISVRRVNSAKHQPAAANSSSARAVSYLPWALFL